MSTTFFAYFSAFSVLFLFAEQLYHRLGITAEHTRKLVHVGAGLLALSFPSFFDSVEEVLYLCFAFMVILFLSRKLGLLRSIEGIDRHSIGSIAFPLSVMLCYSAYGIFDDPRMYYIPMSILTISDPLAAYVGRSHPLLVFQFLEGKSLGGSLAFFTSAWMISLVILYSCGSPLTYDTVSDAIVIAAMTTMAEMLGFDGLDNLTIGFFGSFTLAFLFEHIQL